MIKVEYKKEGIRVEVGEISKYNRNLPFKMNIKKNVSGEHQWGTELNDFWYASFPNTEMFDVEILDSRGIPVYYKRWDVMENGTDFYKSLWIYCKKIVSNGKIPKGLVIGTHDGEFGEWVPVIQSGFSEVLLVEGSLPQYEKLTQNYKNNTRVKTLNEIITPEGGKVEFFEGGAGYTNTVVEKVIRHWETEEIKSSVYNSISINDLILNNFPSGIDWLHLDVEGLDSKLIRSIDESKISLPNFIIFEDYNLSPEEKEEIYSYLKDRGYFIKSDSGICEAVR
jgi:FkbM family methyltransferase